MRGTTWPSRDNYCSGEAYAARTVNFERISGGSRELSGTRNRGWRFRFSFCTVAGCSTFSPCFLCSLCWVRAIRYSASLLLDLSRLSVPQMEKILCPLFRGFFVHCSLFSLSSVPLVHWSFCNAWSPYRAYSLCFLCSLHLAFLTLSFLFSLLSTLSVLRIFFFTILCFPILFFPILHSPRFSMFLFSIPFPPLRSHHSLFPHFSVPSPSPHSRWSPYTLANPPQDRTKFSPQPLGKYRKINNTSNSPSYPVEALKPYTPPKLYFKTLLKSHNKILYPWMFQAIILPRTNIQIPHSLKSWPRPNSTKWALRPTGPMQITRRIRIPVSSSFSSFSRRRSADAVRAWESQDGPL